VIPEAKRSIKTPRSEMLDAVFCWDVPMDKKELYAHEKMSVAVHTLSTGKGGIRTRLRDAYMDVSTLAMPQFAVQDLEIKSRVARILEMLGRVDIAGSEGTIRAALEHKVSDDECVEIAKLILEIYNLLHPRYLKWCATFEG